MRNHAQSMWRGHRRIRGQVIIIIPDETGTPHRLVRYKCADHQQQGQQPGLVRKAVIQGGNRLRRPFA
jgi:hypothetical protein